MYSEWPSSTIRSEASSPRDMLQKGLFGKIRVRRKLHRDTPPRIPRAISEASFESSHPVRQTIGSVRKPKVNFQHVVLKHLELDSSLLTNSSESGNSSDEEVRKETPPAARPKDFLEELMQKYYGKNEIAKTNLASRMKLARPVEVFWEKKRGIGFVPSAREGATLTQVNRKLYLFGGECRTLFNDLMVLNPETWKWEEAAFSHNGDPPPEPRSGHSSAAYKNSLVIFGGGSSFNSLLKLRKCYNRVHLYDTISGNWTTATPTGHAPLVRRCHACAIVGTTMLIYGGVDELGTALDDLLALNLDTMRWFSPRIHKSCELRPGKRHSLSFVPVYSYSVLKSVTADIFHLPNVFDETFTRVNCGVYMFGGATKTGKASNDLFVLKPKPIDYKDDDYYMKWTKPDVSGTPPTARFAYSAALRGKYIAFFGGRNDELHSMSLAVRDIALLNIESMRWECVANYGITPPSCWGSCLLSFRSKIVVFGGMRVDRYCSSKLLIAETDSNTVQEQKVEMDYIRSIREEMGRKAFERVARAEMVTTRRLNVLKESAKAVLSSRNCNSSFCLSSYLIQVKMEERRIAVHCKIEGEVGTLASAIEEIDQTLGRVRGIS